MQCSIRVDLSWQLTAMVWTVKSFTCLSFSISVSIRLWLESHLPSVIRYKPTASPKPQPIWSKDTWHTVTLVQRRGINKLLLKQKRLHSNKQENNKNHWCRLSICDCCNWPIIIRFSNKSCIIIMMIYNKVNISSTCSACCVEEAPWVVSWFNHCTASTHSSSVDWTNAGCHIRTSPENASILNLTHTQISHWEPGKFCMSQTILPSKSNSQWKEHFQVCYSGNTATFHWSQTQFLKGHSSARFSSNPNQTHLIQLIKVFRITRNFQACLILS